MSKRKKISSGKMVDIFSHDTRNATFQGKYFRIKANNPTDYISSLRRLPTQSYGHLLDSFDKVFLNVKSVTTPKRTPKDLLTDFLTYVDCDTEFFWAKNILIRKSIAINTFVHLSNEYSVKVLHANYDDAFRILDKIEHEFGYSVWVIKNKISLHQLAGGLEVQKKYTQDVKKQLKNGGLGRFLFHWISVRNEGQTSVSRFKNQIDQIINRLDPAKQKEFKAYLKYHLLDNELTDLEELAHTLNVSCSASIIDYYETFLSLVKGMLIDSDFKSRAKAVNFLQNHTSNIIDQRLEVLKVLHKIPTTQNCYDQFSENIYENFLKGDFVKASQDSESEVLLGKNVVVNMMVNSFAKAFAFDSSKPEIESNKSLFQIITNALSNIIQRGVIDASKEFNELNKIALNFSDLSWATSIKLIVCKENSLLSNRTKDCSIGISNSQIVHPIFIEFINNVQLGEVYESLCETNYSSILTLSFQRAQKYLLDKDIDDLLLPFQFYIRGLIALESGEYEKSVAYGKKLLNQNQSFFTRRAHGLISHSYVRKGDMKNACISISDCYLSEKNFYPFLPLADLVNSLSPSTAGWKDVHSTVDLSITLDICVKHLDKKFETVRRFAYEDFLLKTGIDRPSQLRPMIKELNLNKIVYYLRFICLENTMDTSGAFEGGSGEVIQERLEICRLLTDIDTFNEETYLQEIKDIVRRQVITSRRQEVDQSRIYVDIKSIKEWAEIELEESFYRYITFLKSGLVKSNKFEQKCISAIDIPEDEVNELLRYMIHEIRAAYLSAGIGLDRFISTRIRHGELERTMRIPIQKHHLITKKNLKNGPYQSNSYWLEKFENASPESLRLAEKAFNTFSEDYDHLISKIANEWLQIKGSDKSNGLFEFIFTEADIQRIADLLNQNTPLNEFIDLVITYLESTLILILIKIREVLNTVGKNEAKKLLSKLYEDIFTNASLTSVELQRSLNQTRTDLTAQFDKIIQWFVPSSEGSSTPYNIEDAILVAEAIIKEATPTFKVNISTNDNMEFSIHGQLPIFVDIFNNIFENVIKRSGLEAPEADIEISYISIGESYFRINIRVFNKLGEDIEYEQVQKTLTGIRETLSKGSYTEFVAKDRNSGLFKIHKSISDFSLIDSDEKPQMGFGLTENGFELEMSVPFKLFH